MGRSNTTQQRGPFGNKHVYAKVFARVIELMERGELVWRRPWKEIAGNGMPLNISSNRPYHGGNVVALWAAQQMYGFERAWWLTFNQAKALGGGIKKGEHGTPVFFMSKLTRKPKDGEDAEEGKGRSFWLARMYFVFNVEQCYGLDDLIARRTEVTAETETPDERMERFAALVKATGADIRHGGDRAYFSPLTDHIQMPLRKQFKQLRRYFGVLAHELVHWTGMPGRCNRRTADVQSWFGKEEYAIEELVAELGSAFLGGQYGFETLDQSAAYLKGWVKGLKDDPSYFARAASAAWKAAEYIAPGADAVAEGDEIEEAA